jgi:hypothetical protein
MAQAEVEAAWQAEFKRIDATEAPDGPRAAFRWSGEARRLQEEHAHHYLRWTFVSARRYDRWPYRRGPIVFGLKRPGPLPTPPTPRLPSLKLRSLQVGAFHFSAANEAGTADGAEAE